MTEPEPTDEQLERALRKRRPAPRYEFRARLSARLHELRWRGQRPPRLWLLVAAWACCGLVLLAIAARAAAAPPSSFTTGFSDGIYEQPATANLWFDHTITAGARVVLLAVDWASIAPERPSGDPTDPGNRAYHWGTLDQAVQGAVAHGLTVALVVAPAGGGPAWADGPGRPAGAPAGTWRPDPIAFGAFATAVARRYSGSFNPGSGVLPHVRYFQAWSEPNLPDHLNPQWLLVNGQWVAESAIIYRGLLNAFYAGVKSVSGSDLVITGGTAPFGDQPGGARVPPAQFVRTLLCLDNRLAPRPCANPAHFDILAHHPYAIGGPFQKAFNADDVSLPDLAKLTRPLAVAERSGRALPRGHKQVWVTEFSWNTNPPNPGGVPVLERAKWIEQTFWELWREGVDTICWYLIVDQAPVPNYGSTYQSGLYYLIGQRKPGFEAFRFPFVVQRVGKRWQVWGISPDGGTVRVQQRHRGRWTTLFSVRRRAGAIFTRTLELASRAPMRARVGGETSISFTPT